MRAAVPAPGKRGRMESQAVGYRLKRIWLLGVDIGLILGLDVEYRDNRCKYDISRGVEAFPPSRGIPKPGLFYSTEAIKLPVYHPSDRYYV